MTDQGEAPPRLASRARIESVVAIGLLVLAIGGYLFSGALTSAPPRPSPGPVSIASNVEPSANPESTATVPGVPTCGPAEVDAVVTDWRSVEQARIATIELRNIGAVVCEVWRFGQPGLYGNGELLIQGGVGSPDSVEVSGPGVVLVTHVQAENYCGPRPDPAVTVAILQEDGFYVATPLSPTDRSGLPPCTDESAPGFIAMEPWAPAEP